MKYVFFLCLSAYGIGQCILQSKEDKNQKQMEYIFILERMTDISIHSISDTTLRKSNDSLREKILDEIFN